MLHLYTSNRLEKLADRLCEQVMQPLSGVTSGLFQADQIVVQNPGMQHWLSMELARRYGIAMNLDFPLLGRALWERVREILGDMPEQDSFRREVLVWRIYDLLPQVVTDADFADPTRYWCPQGKADDLKRYQLARELADLYEQYLMYRPDDFIQAWEQGEDNHWQAQLWRRLVPDARLPGHSLHFMQQALTRLKQPGRPAGLPARLLIVGINTMPPVWVRFLLALATKVEIHLFLLVPTAHYWLDQSSPKQEARQRKAWIQKAGSDTDYIALDSQPLIGAMGRQGQEFLQQFFESGQGVQDHDLCEAPPLTSLLTAVQRDLYELFDRRTSPVEFPPDGSITVMNCHSPLREVQTLHDWLLHQFQQASGLAPRDVLVLCPKIELYSPYIQGVFSAYGSPRGDSPRLAASIADRAARDSHPLVQSFLDMLSLPDSRLKVSEVLAQLRVPAIQFRLGLREEEMDRIEGWLQTAGIHWGFDSAHKGTLGLPERDAFTWAQGLHRLLSGFAMGDQEMWFGGQVVVPPVEGADAVLLGQVVHFVHQLQETRRLLPRSRSAEAWVTTLHGLLDSLYDSQGDDDNEAALKLLREGIGSLLTYTQQAGLEGELSLAVVRDFLQSGFSEPVSTQNFMTGKITFCSTLPMRSIPFRIIAVLGLNDGEFPRQRQPLGFDLMAERGRKAGDRSRRDDDRYLFLETLLSAREALYLSYCGHAVKDNAERQPSLVLSELLAYLSAGFSASEVSAEESLQADWLKQLVTEQPLQPFSARLYSGDQPSFDQGWLQLWQRSPATRTLPVLPVEAMADEQALIELDLDQLVRYFDNPARVFCEKQLGVYLTAPEAALKDSEPFQLDSLQGYGIKQNMLDTLLEPRATENREADPRAQMNAVVDWHLQRGLLPDLPGVEDELQGLAGHIAAFVRGLHQQGIELHRQEALEWTHGPFCFRGVVQGDAETLLYYRAGTLRAKDVLQGWFGLLLAQSCGRPVKQVLIMAPPKDGEEELVIRRLKAVAEPETEMRRWLLAWQAGQQTPQLLNANFVLEAGNEPVTRLWVAGEYSGYDSRCAYHRWLWPAAPESAAVLAECSAFYQTLLDHLEEA
ncbi:MAG: exodeoxyribonuclease V subunit gamma [Hahellaceae bacterium]|nr:exodeoxyribonuclease V subunit gamma [Hahellaceae bacterium]